MVCWGALRKVSKLTGSINEGFAHWRTSFEGGLKHCQSSSARLSSSLLTECINLMGLCHHWSSFLLFSICLPLLRLRRIRRLYRSFRHFCGCCCNRIEGIDRICSSTRRCGVFSGEMSLATSSHDVHRQFTLPLLFTALQLLQLARQQFCSNSSSWRKFAKKGRRDQRQRDATLL